MCTYISSIKEREKSNLLIKRRSCGRALLNYWDVHAQTIREVNSSRRTFQCRMPKKPLMSNWRKAINVEIAMHRVLRSNVLLSNAEKALMSNWRTEGRPASKGELNWKVTPGYAKMALIHSTCKSRVKNLVDVKSFDIYYQTRTLQLKVTGMTEDGWKIEAFDYKSNRSVFPIKLLPQILSFIEKTTHHFPCKQFCWKIKSGVNLNDLCFYSIFNSHC